MTGAGSGIGRATARRLAAEGAAVTRAKAGMAIVVNANAATARHRVLKVGPDHLKPLILVLS